MDCTSLCLLALAVSLKPSADTKKCAYCMDMRALTTECDAEPQRCAYRANTDAHSLIYCLTAVETPHHSAAVRRVVRCVSHAVFNLTLSEFREASRVRECNFDALRECDCPNCRPPGRPRDYYMTVNDSITHYFNDSHISSQTIESLKENNKPATRIIRPNRLAQNFTDDSSKILQRQRFNLFSAFSSAKKVPIPPSRIFFVISFMMYSVLTYVI